ncbi:hypothetical protein FACS1894172_16810 [Spirochaetia bacterium]|nr:hypothetical protein FACS1894172_16810 [Spirochaetia bacterium]
MENNILVKKFEERVAVYLNVLSDIIEMCPEELWNKKCSGYIVSQQLVHTFSRIYLWFRIDEKNKFR